MNKGMSQDEFGRHYAVHYQQVRARYRRQLIVCSAALGLSIPLLFLVEVVLLLHEPNWIAAAFAPGFVLAGFAINKVVKVFRWWREINKVCFYAKQAATLRTQIQVDSAFDQMEAAIRDYNKLPP